MEVDFLMDKLVGSRLVADIKTHHGFFFLGFKIYYQARNLEASECANNRNETKNTLKASD